MFAVVSRCIAHSFFFISFITAEDAVKTSVWYNDDHEGDNVIFFNNVPTMMFTQSSNILRFLDFTWIKADITATRSVASAWRYGTGRDMLPPRPLTPTTRSCEVSLQTAPTYNCIGFGPAFTPKLAQNHGPHHPRSINIIGDIFQIAILHRQLRPRHIHVTLEEWEPLYPGDNGHGIEDGAQGGAEGGHLGEP